MNKSCIHCSKTFQIYDRDQEFYNRLSVPAPTHCPDCRTQRRMAWRNERTLYSGTCDKCQKAMLSRFKPNSGYIVYCQDCYRSDNWTAADYGRDFDFSKLFFEQWSELEHAVPQINLYSVRSENADYCNYVGDVKNSFLCYGSINIEDCLFGSPYYSKQCVDSLLIRNCELCYECITCERLYHCQYCQDCFDSRDLLVCYDVKASHDCIGCVGLRNASFMIFNQQYSEADYFSYKAKLELADIKDKFTKVLYTTPHRFMTGLKNESVTGNHINESTNAYDCFDVRKVENTSYAAQVIDLKDCYDINYTEENELCYEYWGNYRNTRCLYSATSYGCTNLTYSTTCESSHDLFGCTGVRKGEYMILNKAYSQTEYEALVETIKQHMLTTGEYGEFFPAKYSSFAYNETVAQEYFPLSQEQIKQAGWQWFDIPEATQTSVTGARQCSSCAKAFRIILQEQSFYDQEQLAVPTLCPNCRHVTRLQLRTPRSLWTRQCMCTQPEHNHSARCSNEFSTTYNSDRKELIYCESCYNQTVV